MPLQIDGVSYYSAAELQVELGISRQTFWRWRHDGKIPAGYRYRNGQILLNAAECQAVREYANHLEPADAIGAKAIKLLKSTMPSKKRAGAVAGRP